MSERSDKRGSVAGCALGLGLLLALLSALYVFGLGPATWIGEHYPETQEVIVTIYLPLALLAESCQPIKSAIEWYVAFWV